MSARHPIISITGSSGAGTTTVTTTFQQIFRREGVRAVIVQGDAFHRYDRDTRGIDFSYLLSMLPDSFMSRANTIVCPGSKMPLAMQLIFTPMIWQLMDRKEKRAMKSYDFATPIQPTGGNGGFHGLQ